jgi:hypothetical protein
MIGTSTQHNYAVTDRVGGGGGIERLWTEREMGREEEDDDGSRKPTCGTLSLRSFGGLVIRKTDDADTEVEIRGRRGEGVEEADEEAATWDESSERSSFSSSSSHFTEDNPFSSSGKESLQSLALVSWR